jgi:hypothetical protein
MVPFSLSPHHPQRPNQSLEPTAGRRTTKLTVTKARLFQVALALASGGWLLVADLLVTGRHLEGAAKTSPSEVAIPSDVDILAVLKPERLKIMEAFAGSHAFQEWQIT